MESRGLSAVLLLLLAVGHWSVAHGECPIIHPNCECRYDGHNIIVVILCTGFGPQEALPTFNASDVIIPTLRIENSTIYKLQTAAFNGLKIRNLFLNNLRLSLVEPNPLQGLEPFLESLELKNSRFTVLPDRFLYNFTSLNSLALDRNMLDAVKDTWFMYLRALSYLSLSGNRIRHIEPHSFDLMPRLRVLYLTENKLTDVAGTLFSQLQELREIGLGSNNISSLPPKLFHNLVNLRWLELSRNQIESIPIELFKDTHSIQELYMPGNKIKEIGSYHLPTGRSLKVLVLSNNNISVLQDSAFNSIRNLSKLALDNNNIKVLPDLSFESLTVLEFLYLQDNEINELPANILVGLLQLKELNLQHNKIKVLTYGVFDPLGRLFRLDVSQNLLNEVHFGPFDALRLLKYLDLSRNQLPKIESNWFRKSESLQELHMDHNVIRSIEERSFIKMVNLEALYLDYNYIQELDANMFSKNGNLRILSLAHNPLQIVPAASFEAMYKLQKLYLNYTCLSDIPDGLFEDLSGAKELYLDHSPLEILRSNSFDPLRSLQTLIIGYHNISRIEHRPFSQMTNVTNFAADNMGLTTEHLANILIDLPKAKRISLKYNSLDSVQKDAFSSNLQLRELNLLGNPMVCNCQLGWLREFEQLLDVQTTVCEDPDSLATHLAACFPLAANCPNMVPTASTERQCQTTNIQVPAKEEFELDYSHCMIPIEPTTPKPTTVSPTPFTTVGPVIISVAGNISQVTVTWERKTNPNIVGYRVRYRPFASSHYKTSPDLRINETTFYIRDLESVDYRICVDIKFEHGYARHEQGCEEIRIAGPNITTKDKDFPDVVTEVVSKSDLPLVPIVGASAAALVVLFIVIVIIVFCLRKTKTRFAENAMKKEQRDKMVKDKMGAWVTNFNFDGNVNETMGEQMLLDYDLFSGSNPTVSKARYAQMLKEANGAIPIEIKVENAKEASELPTPVIKDDDMFQSKADFSEPIPATELPEDEYPGDVSGSDPGYGESETGYNGSDSMQGDSSLPNEHILF